MSEPRLHGLKDFTDFEVFFLYLQGLWMLYEDTTKRIIGCAMKVHSALGNVFQEVIYQRALAIEMRYEQIQFEREKKCRFYTGMNW